MNASQLNSSHDIGTVCLTSSQRVSLCFDQALAMKVHPYMSARGERRIHGLRTTPYLRARMMHTEGHIAKELR